MTLYMKKGDLSLRERSPSDFLSVRLRLVNHHNLALVDVHALGKSVKAVRIPAHTTTVNGVDIVVCRHGIHHVVRDAVNARHGIRVLCLGDVRHERVEVMLKVCVAVALHQHRQQRH